jgi:hypothetical protein
MPAAVAAAAASAFLLAAKRGPVGGGTVMALLLVGVLIAAVVRWSVAALCTMIVYVPLQDTLLAYLWHQGVLPASLARDAGYLKELVVVGLVVASARTPAALRRPFTNLDRVLVAYGALVGVYLALPFFLHGELGAQTAYIRLAASRVEYLYLLLLLTLRRLRWSRRDLRAVELSLLAVAAIVAASGLYELLDRAAYARFFTTTIDQIGYEQKVLGANVVRLTPVITENQNGTGFVRNGGLFLDQLTLGFFLVLPVALCLRRLAVRRRQILVAILALVGGGVLINSFTRSAILAAVVAVIVVLGPGLRRGRPRAVLVAGALIAALVLVAPAFGSGRLLERIVGATNGQDASATAHHHSTDNALGVFERHPLGLGLGSNPATAVTQQSTNGITAENAYLQVGLELGWAGLALFAVVVVLTLMELLARARRGPPAALAAYGALLGLSLGGFLLHVWLTFAVSLVVWGVAGAVFATDPPTERKAAALAEGDSVHCDHVADTPPGPANVVRHRTQRGAVAPPPRPGPRPAPALPGPPP